jgi:hypothetical protein
MAKTVEAARPTPDDPFPAGAHPLDWRRSGLDALGKRVCRAFAEAALADEDERGELVPPSDELLDRVVHKLDLWLGTGSAQLKFGFVALVLAMESLPLAIIRSPKRMSNLPLRERLRYLEKLEESKNGMLSMLLVAFKVPLLTSAYEEGELLRETGFDRPTLASRRGASHAARPGAAKRPVTEGGPA